MPQTKTAGAGGGAPATGLGNTSTALRDSTGQPTSQAPTVPREKSGAAPKKTSSKPHVSATDTAALSRSLHAGHDAPLFNLTDDGKWRLAADGLQWIVQIRCRRPNAKSDGYEGRAFIAGRKETLLRVIAEKGIALSDAARDALDRLPEPFAEFRATWPDWKGARASKKHGAIAIAARNDLLHPSPAPVPRNAIPIGYAVRLATSHHNGGWAPCAGLPACEHCQARVRAARSDAHRRDSRGAAARKTRPLRRSDEGVAR